MEGAVRIGIAGSGPSVGVTHFSIMTACYISGVLRRKAAVLEWNPSGDFARIRAVHSKKEVARPAGKTFNILDIFFCGEAGKRELADCSGQGFEVIVIDFGVFRDEIREDFLSCSRRFLIGSASEWQLPAFAAFLSGKEERGYACEYFSAFGDRETAETAGRIFKVRIRQIPPSPNAFIVTGESLAFFWRFLK